MCVIAVVGAAPCSKVTLTAFTRAGAGASTSGSRRTAPVKYSAGSPAQGLGAVSKGHAEEGLFP